MPDYNPYTISRCRDCDIAKGKLELAFVPENELCAACKIINKCYADKSKSLAAIERTHYLHDMEPLLNKKVTINNGHDMHVGFYVKGNKHLYSDTFSRCSGINKEDLAKLDKILSSATFVCKSGLCKPRKDDIKRFYYYRAIVNERTVYMNVAKTDFKRPNGIIYHSRFLYSITDKIKE